MHRELKGVHIILGTLILQIIGTIVALAVLPEQGMFILVDTTVIILIYIGFRRGKVLLP
jgi:hypothetical protein